MMRHRVKQLVLGALMLLLSAAPIAAKSVQADAPNFAITHFSVDNSGHIASGEGRFTISSTFGQADATAVQGLSRFQLSGGFWSAIGGEKVESVFLPLIQMD